MKRILIALFALVLALGLNVAEAKRLGGGSSFGMSRNTAPMQRQALPPKQATPQPGAPAPAAPPPATAGSRWGGMLGGLALGAGLGALLGGFGGGMGGFGGGGLMTLLLVVGGVILVTRLLARRTAAAPPHYAGAGAPVTFDATPAAASGATLAAVPNPHVPADFDTAGFLRQAKLNFVRLQAANDAGNMDDIKTFSTPEFFAEIEMQFLERGKTKQQTDVVQLDAQLLEVAQEEKRHVASVRFFGQLRETPQAAPEDFDEVWHLIKPVDGSSGWSVAGIQQVS